MILNRSGSNEYYNSLPQGIKSTAKGTSQAQAGYIYYFADSNAFSLNFADLDISPFEVVKIGHVDDESLIQMLSTGPKSIEVNIFSL